MEAEFKSITSQRSIRKNALLSKTTVFSDGSAPESDHDDDEEESASVMKCRIEINKMLG